MKERFDSSVPAMPSLVHRASKAYLRLKSSTTRENLWLYILRMLLDKPMYAYEIGKELNDRFGFSTATVTVYVVLYKLQRENLIQSYDEKTVRGRPSRKYYIITELGKEELKKGIKLLQDTIHLLEYP
ncbi:MAG: PadR family transcriptional regulator [Candidatus Bathyarchaeia archaeon]